MREKTKWRMILGSAGWKEFYLLWAGFMVGGSLVGYAHFFESPAFAYISVALAFLLWIISAYKRLMLAKKSNEEDNDEDDDSFDGSAIP